MFSSPSQPKASAAAIAAGAAMLAALLICLCVVPATALAGAGRLDPAFGDGGIATTPLETAGKGAVELGVGPDGAAVVGDTYGYFVRFGPDGAPDPAFGEGGKLTFSESLLGEGVAERKFEPSNLAVDGTGRLLVFGRQSDARHVHPIPGTEAAGNGVIESATESEAVVLRFDQEGKLDPTFGAGRGFVRSGFGLHSELHTPFPAVGAFSGTVDSKNRPVFVVGAAALELGCYAGAVTYYPRGVVRLTEAGAIDGSFGEDGVAPISGSVELPALAIDARERPALGLGQYRRPELNCRAGTALARLGANGQRVGSFGSRGIEQLGRNLHLDFVTPGGAIVLSHGSGRMLDLVRIGLSGRPDGDFGARAKLRLPAGAHVRPVGVDAKGRIVLAGIVGANGPYPVLSSKIARPPTFAVARLLPDGRLDRSFGEGGWLLDRVPGTDEVGANAARIDSQGRLLIAATITAPGQASGGYLLARFLLGS